LLQGSNPFLCIRSRFCPFFLAFYLHLSHSLSPYRFLINQLLRDTLNIRISCRSTPIRPLSPSTNPYRSPGLYNNWFSMRIISPHTPTPENVNGRDTLALFCCDPTYQLTPPSIQHHQ